MGPPTRGKLRKWVAIGVKRRRPANDKHWPRFGSLPQLHKTPFEARDVLQFPAKYESLTGWGRWLKAWTDIMSRMGTMGHPCHLSRIDA
jgi:hypothetical protein